MRRFHGRVRAFHRQLWGSNVVNAIHTWVSVLFVTTHIGPNALDQSSTTNSRTCCPHSLQPFFLAFALESHIGFFEPAEEVGPRGQRATFRRADMTDPHLRLHLFLRGRDEGEVDECTRSYVYG